MRFLTVVLVFFLLAACDNAPKSTQTSFSGATMGTTFTVKVVNLPDTMDPNVVGVRLESILKEVNAKMSLWVQGSEIIRFNQSTSTEWQPVSKDLLAVTSAAQQISQQTDGFYDVTIEPLIKLWGFSTGNKTNTPPTPEEIQSALQFIGYQKIELDQERMMMRKLNPSTTINLSSIAKGFGIDQLAQYLEGEGIDNYMVEIGGDLRVKGSNAQGEPWHIAIEKPEAGTRAVQQIIALNRVGMATSGDYRNFFEKDGQRFTHIIDPRTGNPVKHRLASVTVLAENAMMADGWATALLALGEVNGPKLANEKNISALFIIRNNNGFSEIKSASFEKFEKSVK